MLGGLLIMALGLWAIAMWSSFSDCDGRRDVDLLTAERDELLTLYRQNAERLEEIRRVYES